MSEEETKKDGAFVASLKRNNKQIREDRADAIVENAEMTYKRSIEDLIMLIRRTNRSRENMLDLSPTNAQSLMLGNDFDAVKFVQDDVQAGIDMRNAEIKLEIMRKQYEYLFGMPAPELN
jgi:hypothetical protein